MNKKEKDFHTLVKDLQTYENLIGGHKKKGSKPHNSGNGSGTIKAEANLASTSRPKTKKKWKNSKKSVQAVKTVKKKKAGTHGDILKGKCFYCNEKGHWKPQYPKLLTKKQAQAA
ncbi:hypothetical protein CsatA_012565 [Cannabis sativa]